MTTVVILGNNTRLLMLTDIIWNVSFTLPIYFLEFSGRYRIHEIDKICCELHQSYGNIVKLSGLLGRPDMVFLFDADEVEKVFRTEELMPYRPSMPSLNYYKHVLRKNFFGDMAGVIAV